METRDDEAELTDIDLSRRTDVFALMAEVEALRKDAERYRWLRQYANGIYMDVFNDDDAAFLNDGEAGLRLDAAIDAAPRFGAA